MNPQGEWAILSDHLEDVLSEAATRRLLRRHPAQKVGGNLYDRLLPTLRRLEGWLERHAGAGSAEVQRKLQGLPIWEFKTHLRGGVVGGTRIYFYLRAQGMPVIVNAEIKEGDAPGSALREAVLVAYAAQGRP